MADKEIFKEKFYPRVNVALNDKVNSDKLIRYINNYMDKNSEILFDKGIAKRLMFSDSDINIVYTCTESEENKISVLIKESGQTKSEWKLFNKPFNWLMVNVLRYYYLNKKEREFSLILSYFALSFYSSIHFKQFPYPPNENIMDYTINNLSNKYDIKKFGSLFKALYKVITNCHEKYKDYLESFSDYEIVQYMMNLRTRINNFVVEISRRYYENRDKGNYMNYEKDNKDPENYHEVDNQSFVIERLAEKVRNKFISNGIDTQIVGICSNMTEIGKKTIMEAMNGIKDKENDSIKEMVTLILQQYLIVENQSIESVNSKKFITICNKIYGKSNTTDKGVIRIKEILDRWLSENSDKYNKVERVATKINFRKSIYLYFVFFIQKVAGNN